MSSLSLAKAGLLSNNKLVQGIVAEILTVDAFSRVLPFVTVEGKALTYNRSLNTADTAAWYSVGDTVNKTPASITQVTASFGRIVADAEVDALEELTMSEVTDQMKGQIEEKSRAIGRLWKQGIITGTGSNGEIEGINSLCDPSQVLDIATTTSSSITFSGLEQLLAMVTAKDGDVDFIAMNSSALRDYRALVRSTAGAVETMELGFLDPITGKRGSLTVNGFNGIPIFANDYIGTETLATVHTGVTRIYAGCLGEGVGLTGFIPARTDKLVELSPPIYHQDRDSMYRRLRLIAGLALYSSKALAQWQKVKTST
jgi:hypothetical protein